MIWQTVQFIYSIPFILALSGCYTIPPLEQDNLVLLVLNLLSFDDDARKEATTRCCKTEDRVILSGSLSHQRAQNRGRGVAEPMISRCTSLHAAIMLDPNPFVLSFDHASFHCLSSRLSSVQGSVAFRWRGPFQKGSQLAHRVLPLARCLWLFAFAVDILSPATITSNALVALWTNSMRSKNGNRNFSFRK